MTRKGAFFAVFLLVKSVKLVPRVSTINKNPFSAGFINGPLQMAL